jgi:CHRD domain
MTRFVKRFGAFGAVGAALAVGSVLAAGTAGAQVNVNAAAFRLKATLTGSQAVPAVQAPRGAVGHFDGVLFRSGVGPARAAALAGCTVITPPRRSGLPTRISCGGSVFVLPARGRWHLLWRLSVSGLSGPVTAADIQIAPARNAAPLALTLCAPCRPVSQGHLVVTPGQAAALLGNAAYANVATAAHPGGEIRGRIVRAAIGLSAGRR